jgi:hypothetical protein
MQDAYVDEIPKPSSKLKKEHKIHKLLSCTRAKEHTKLTLNTCDRAKSTKKLSGFHEHKDKGKLTKHVYKGFQELSKAVWRAILS